MSSSAAPMLSVSPAYPQDDRAAWIAEHKVGWRLGPYREHVKDHGVVQTGFELVLFGRFVPAAGNDVPAIVRSLHQSLHALALQALDPVPPDVFLTVLPSNHWIVPAEQSFSIEVELVVIASLARPDAPPTPDETRQRVAAVEASLRAMGLHKR
jgi:hypothetical protein